MTAAQEERPVRTCAECGETDSAPMHRIVVNPAGESEQRHLVCCSVTGCLHDTDDPRHCTNAVKALV